MRLVLDLDNLTWRNPANPAAALPSISMRRGDVISVDVAIRKAGAAHELPSDATGILQINPAGTYGTAAKIAGATSFTKLGAGREALYCFTVTLGGAAMDTAFTGNPAEVEAAMELQLSFGGEVHTSAPLALAIQNALIHP